MRQIVLDTETTGLEPELGHRIIEIGAVEVVGRRLTGRRFHEYVNPDRAIDEGAIQVHGITSEFLADKPRFEAVSAAFVEFVRGAELIIHNAPFDTAFLNAEFRRLADDPGPIASFAEITDSLVLARRRHPGQKNNLDALCRRYGIDNSDRELHGALLDAEILAEVYLAMTGGQTALSLGEEAEGERRNASEAPRRLGADRPRLRVVRASPEEADAHHAMLERLEEGAESGALWRRLETGGAPDASIDRD